MTDCSFLRLFESLLCCSGDRVNMFMVIVIFTKEAIAPTYAH
ncbi:MAG: hypothetical protein WBA76_05510 [Phormidesmis sp.]